MELASKNLTSSNITNDNHYETLTFNNLLNFITITSLYTEMICCLVLNTLSLAYILYSKVYSSINMLIINLAIADMLYASCIPFYVGQFSSIPVSQTKIGCRISFILDVSSMIVIVFTIAALTLERYVFIKAKQLPENKKSKLIIIYIIFLWILAVCYSLPKALSIEERQYDGITVCNSKLDEKLEKINIILKWILAFAFPYTIIIIFSTLLLIFLKEWSKNSEKLKSGQSSDATTVKSNKLGLLSKLKYNLTETKPLKAANSALVELNGKSNQMIEQNLHNVKTQPNNKISRLLMIKKRTTRFVLSVVFSFLCCWSPLWIYQIIIIFTDSDSPLFQTMHHVNLIVVYMGGVIDPLLYMLLTQNFREFFSSNLKKIF